MIILIGASSGIGSKMLPELNKIDDIVAFYNKNKIKSFKRKYKIFEYKINLNNEFEIKKFILRFKPKLKKIICLNFAAMTLDKLAININQKDLENIFKVNTFSNILIAKYLLPIMIEQNFGRFIHISSTKALLGDKGILGYASSKASLSGISTCLAKEYGKFGITSNILSLGYFKSSLWDRLPTIKQRELLEEVPSKKLGNTKNIVNMIKALITSDYINSSMIKIDGGI